MRNPAQRWTRVLSLILVCTASIASAQDTGDARGRAIADELSRRNAGFGDLSAELELLMRDDRGRETRRGLRLRVLERPEADHGDLSLLVFDDPADVRGTALLSRAGVSSPDEQWLYLPAAGRVRRVSTSSATGAFLGSEFTYEDITGGEVGKYSWRFVAERACPGSSSEQCFEVETRPRYDGSGYSRRVVFIETGEYRIRQIEFYDRRDTLQKRLTYSEYQQHGRHWRAHRWTMENLQTHRTTVLSFTRYRFGNGLSESDFTPAALERAR